MPSFEYTLPVGAEPGKTVTVEVPQSVFSSVVQERLEREKKKHEKELEEKTADLNKQIEEMKTDKEKAIEKAVKEATTNLETKYESERKKAERQSSISKLLADKGITLTKAYRDRLEVKETDEEQLKEIEKVLAEQEKDFVESGIKTVSAGVSGNGGGHTNTAKDSELLAKIKAMKNPNLAGKPDEILLEIAKKMDSKGLLQK